MCDGRVFLLLSALLSHVTPQHPPPFIIDGLFVNTSTRAVEGVEVCLHCDYFVQPRPHSGFTMHISFFGGGESDEGAG